MPVTIITSSQTFSRPADWNDSSNSLEAIGGGAGGSTNGQGGGGGAYAKSVNYTIAASNSVVVGAGGSAEGGGGVTYLHTGSAYAVYAAAGSITSGGNTASCIYNSVAYNGGNGNVRGTPGAQGGAGGGGAAGKTGGGSSGAANSGTNGGAGGGSPTASGGGGGVSSAGGTGGNGTDFTTHGAGGGGGGGAAFGHGGGAGGYYGGGGGGAGTGGGAGGPGRSGLFVATWTAAVPTVSLVTPSGGSILGGTAVTITGTNFTGATGVTFDGTTATSISVVDSTTITCVTPAHAQGQVDVVVTGPGGSGTGTNAYRYGNTPFPAARDLAISSSAPTVTKAITVWFPPQGNLVIQGFAPTLAFAAVSPNISPPRVDQIISSIAPTVANTAFRNIEIPQANLFTDVKIPFVERTIRNPAFDLGAQLTMSKYAPTLHITTDSVPIDIIAEDPDEVFAVYAD